MGFVFNVDFALVGSEADVCSGAANVVDGTVAEYSFDVASCEPAARCRFATCIACRMSRTICDEKAVSSERRVVFVASWRASDFECGAAFT
jgi:hypothetical protein